MSRADSLAASDKQVQDFVLDGEISEAEIDAGAATGSKWISLERALYMASKTAGQVATFGMSAPPAGWLKANGATVSRATYAALFAAIGTTFGVGDGATTFGLPDLRGEFVRGWDDARGVDAGRALGSVQTDDFKSHDHPTTGTSYGLSTPYGSSPTAVLGSMQPGSGGGYSNAVAAQGGTETRPRNIALLACIKY